MGKTRKGAKHGYHRWEEESIYWNSGKCRTKNPGCESTNQHTHRRLNQGGIIARIKLVREI